MQVLLTAATPFEIAPTLAFLEREYDQLAQNHFRKEGLEVQLCIAGVGMLSTAFRLSSFLGQSKCDFAINAGIGGALDPNFAIGDVVHVVEETLGDLGVETADGSFMDLFELGFANPEGFPFTKGKIQNPNGDQLRFLPTASGITLNKAQGTAATIARCREKYPEVQVESMEGAAFFYACLQANLPFVQIRAISNYVEPRNREAWDLPLAIKNLNLVLEQMLGGLS